MRFRPSQNGLFKSFLRDRRGVSAVTFAITFAVGGTLIYLLCLHFNWPLFTFHPATNRIAFGWEAARSGEGPAMYWYGWIATMLIGSTLFGAVAARLPSLGDRIPLFLIWLLPLVPLVRCRRGLAASALLGLALLLTQVWFPIRYFDMVAFDELPSWVLLARDLVLVALVAVLVEQRRAKKRSEQVAAAAAIEDGPQPEA